MRFALAVIFSFFIHSAALITVSLIILTREPDLKFEPPSGQTRIERIVCSPDHAYQHLFGLRRLDPIAFEMARSLSHHPIFDLKGVRFYII